MGGPDANGGWRNDKGRERMRITTTETFLRVASHTLETKLMPELTTSEGKASAEILRQLIVELLRREGAAYHLVEDLLASGTDILVRLRAFCASAGIAGGTGSASATPDTGDTPAYRAMIDRHEAMTADIAALAEKLVAWGQANPGHPRRGEAQGLVHDAGLWDQAYLTTNRELPAPDAPVIAPNAGAPLDTTLLQAFLEQAADPRVGTKVVDLSPIPGGFGKQTYRARIARADGGEGQYIVRKSDPMPMVVMGSFLIDEEYHLLRDVHAAGVLPVAEPLLLGKNAAGVDADFYLMTALQGAVPSSFLGAASARIPEDILLQMAECMARLHQMPLDRLGTYLKLFGHPDTQRDTIQSTYRRAIRQWRDYYANGTHLPSPFTIYLLDWLETNLPDHQAAPVLVHGDFNIHNVLVHEGRITGILDWECSNIGAPEQDLAYVRAIVSQHIDWDRFVAHYEASGGRKIDRPSLDYYMVFSAMRLCVVFNKGFHNLQDEKTRDIRYSVIELALTPEFMKQALACIAAYSKR